MEQLLRIVKPFGRGGAHIILPKKLIGKKVRVEIQEEKIKIDGITYPVQDFKIKWENVTTLPQ